MQVLWRKAKPLTRKHIQFELECSGIDQRSGSVLPSLKRRGLITSRVVRPRRYYLTEVGTAVCDLILRHGVSSDSTGAEG